MVERQEQKQETSTVVRQGGHGLEQGVGGGQQDK